MIQALSITQIICGWIVFILFLALMAVGILALASRIFEVYYRRGLQAQYQSDMDRLKTASYWFSEDIPTMNLVRNLAEMGDITRVRDTWRADQENKDVVKE